MRLDATPVQGTILAIDDFPDALHVISAVLRPNYRVLAALSGEDGLHRAGGAPTPDLILLDVGLPGIDGHQVPARLRDDARTREIPVIFLTGRRDAESVEHGLRQGQRTRSSA